MTVAKSRPSTKAAREGDLAVVPEDLELAFR